MKKLMLLGMAATMLFLACSKDKDKGIETKAYTATELTAASVAFHGSVVKGELPAASTNAGAPVLSGDMSGETYAGVAGRYIIVPLLMEEGTPAGVYAKVDGADSYFNVDFSKPRNARKADDRKHGFARSGYPADSSLIIKLPADVKTGDIKLKVAVVDAEGNVSNTVTITVNLYNTAAEGAAQAFAGKWSMTRYQEGANAAWKDNLKPDTTFTDYACVNNQLQWAAPGTEGAVNLISSIYTTNEEYVQLNGNGTGSHFYNDSSVYLVTYEQPCDSRKYQRDGDTDVEIMSWYYNPTTKQLITISEALESAYDFDVEVVSAKIENGKLIIVDGDWTAEYVKK